MARLPSEQWLIQKIDDEIVLFHAHLDDEILRVPFYGDPDVRPGLFARGVKTVHDAYKDGTIDEEDKEFAIFWLGYFYAHSTLD